MEPATTENAVVTAVLALVLSLVQSPLVLTSIFSVFAAWGPTTAGEYSTASGDEKLGAGGTQIPTTQAPGVQFHRPNSANSWFCRRRRHQSARPARPRRCCMLRQQQESTRSAYAFTAALPDRSVARST